MTFDSRSEFIEAQASEKIVLAHVHANSRLYNWTLHSGSIYKRVTDYFVTGLKQENTAVNQVFTLGGVVENTWYYDIESSTIYAHITGGGSPQDEEMIVTYRFFYADAPVTASWDLTDTGKHVYYSGQIKSSPGFKHKIGVDQKLVSVVGQGDLKLENNDGSLDEIYDTLIFENQQIVIYNWNRDLDFSEHKTIYRGRVTNKRYNATEVVFKVKDGLYDLLQNVPQTPYDDTDNVVDSVKGRYKRWLYGRVDGLRLQSIDQIADGYAIPNGDTVSAAPGSTVLTGVNTTFLADLSPDDTLVVGTQEFKIASIESDLLATLDDEPDFAFNVDVSATNLVPSIPTTIKNREMFVAGHACAKLTKLVSSILQLNRIQLNNTEGLIPGDFVEFNTGERIEIKTVAPNNIIVLRKNIIQVPTIGSDVIRQPIQELFIESEAVNSDKFTISNVVGETKVTLASDVEFEIARTEGLGFSATFTNGSREVTTSGQPDLTQIIQPRDWVRSTNLTYTTFYEVLQVESDKFYLRTVFSDPTITSAVEGKKPTYVGDNTIVSANALGKTVDGEPTGSWIQTGAEAVLDLLTEIDVPDINTASFSQAAIDNSELLSIAIPSSPSGAAVTTKSVIDKISKSVNSALTLDEDLKMQYRTLLPEISDDPVTISDNQVITWSITSVNGDMIRNSLIRYRHADVDRFTLESGSQAVSFSSDFVEKYIGTNVTQELDIYLYNERSARIMSHREVYFRSMARAEVRILTDLRFESLDIGDHVILDFDRLYKRFGDKTSRKKVCIIVGKTVTGDKVELFLSDFGNILNRSSIITPNTAPDYSAATEDEKIKYGYITDSRGIVDDDEDTANVHLIT